ncbi:MAG: hypothetical protein V1850_07680 [Candidatus Bathyarchaeota archaeon]
MATKAVVPTIRAMVAKELRGSYKMKQEEIANLLGLTQSAVSQYLGNIRGRTLDIEGIKEVETIVKNLASILRTNSTPKDICQLYCEACRIIRAKRIMCQLHSRLDPLFNTVDCDICISDTCFNHLDE